MKERCKFFAEKMRERRIALGMTQKAVADALGYSEKTVSKWESGEVIAPSVILAELALVLKTDVNSLLEYGTETYFLGIDGGGTKTEFVLSDSGGKIISDVTLEGCNPVDIGFKRTSEILADGIALSCGDIPTSSVCVFAGIAGGITGDNRSRIKSCLKGYGFKSVSNGSDAENAVSAALGDKNGTIVIMGTGSIAFSQIDGELVRRGGYGYLFESGGSGFSVGRAAIMRALDEEDGAKDCSLIGANVRELLGGRAASESISELYAGGKRRIASFVSAVFNAYRDGDSVAEKILLDNMSSVARLIESTPVTCDSSIPQKVVLMGGLAKHADVLLPMIKSALSDKEKYSLSVDLTRPVMGALALAKREV